MEEGFLAPVPDEWSGPFWEGTSAGELRMQACASCGRFRFPPRAACPWCHLFEIEWRRVSGRGTVWSFVVPHPPLLRAYEAWAPFNVILVELDEDPTLRLTGNLLATEDGHVNEVDPATIRIGERVRVVFRPIPEGLVVPQWVRE